MIELEDRLRATLTELAESVPPSQHPRANLERRLAKHKPSRGRRPLLVAAAAVVLVAGIAVPVALNRGTGEAPSASQQDAPSGPRPGNLDPRLNDPYQRFVIEPVEVGTFTEQGTTWRAMVMVQRTPRGDVWTEELCVVGVTEPRTETYANSGCTPMPSWQGEWLVESRGVLEAPGGGPLPDRLVFVTAPQVHTLEVREADGKPAQVTELGREYGFALYLAVFSESHQGYGYTAKDATGTVLEEALT